MGADIKRAIASAGVGDRPSTRLAQLRATADTDAARGSMCAAIKGTLQLAMWAPGGAVKAAAAAAAANAVNPEPPPPPPLRSTLPEVADTSPLWSVLHLDKVVLVLPGSGVGSKFGTTERLLYIDAWLVVVLPCPGAAAG